NRVVRTVRVSLEVGEHSSQARRILLDFKPDQIVISDASKDGSSDTRSLGMALHRLRVRTN
ncbi:MAG: hypothetical protein QOG73_4019, partial [Acetobacteraceae bacterium]|nr:hypothetical protein [Acetobacteraceae bacterium]